MPRGSWTTHQRNKAPPMIKKHSSEIATATLIIAIAACVAAAGPYMPRGSSSETQSSVMPSPNMETAIALPGLFERLLRTIGFADSSFERARGNPGSGRFLVA